MRSLGTSSKKRALFRTTFQAFLKGREVLAKKIEFHTPTARSQRLMHSGDRNGQAVRGWEETGEGASWFRSQTNRQARPGPRTQVVGASRVPSGSQIRADNGRGGPILARPRLGSTNVDGGMSGGGGDLLPSRPLRRPRVTSRWAQNRPSVG